MKLVRAEASNNYSGSTPRSDGLEIHARPRSALRKPDTYFTASRRSKADDLYTGAWRTHNQKSPFYHVGKPTMKADAVMQQKFQGAMQRHKMIAGNFFHAHKDVLHRNPRRLAGRLFS